MKTLVVVAALSVAGIQAQAATVNFTFKSGPLQVTTSCVANYAEGCLEPQIALPPAIQHVSFQVPIAFESGAVRFADGIGTIAWDSTEYYDGETIGLAASVGLVDEDSGEIYIDGATEFVLRSLGVKVDTTFTVIETFFSAEFYSHEFGPLWYVDSIPSGAVVNQWGYDPKLEGKFHLMTFVQVDAPPTSVPLPASAPMFLVACAGLAALRRRQSVKT
jgi:hypothetical protein